MIDIFTISGDRYSYDEYTARIFKDGKLLSSTVAEPLYKNTEEGIPSFVGIYLKDRNNILSLSGNINPVTDPNTI
jgi:hypothetical protein